MAHRSEFQPSLFEAERPCVSWAQVKERARDGHRGAAGEIAVALARLAARVPPCLQARAETSRPAGFPTTGREVAYKFLTRA